MTIQEHMFYSQYAKVTHPISYVLEFCRQMNRCKNSILHGVQSVIHVLESCQLLHTIHWEKYLPIISRIVSGLKGVHVPFDSATCNSSAEMYPLLSLSTLEQIKNQP